MSINPNQEFSGFQPEFNSQNNYENKPSLNKGDMSPSDEKLYKRQQTPQNFNHKEIIDFFDRPEDCDMPWLF